MSNGMHIQSISNVLDKYRDDAPLRVKEAIMELGIKLVERDDFPDEISGHLKRLPDGKYEIAFNASEPFTRQRFTMAHELGHYVLHRSLVGDGVDDTTKYRSTSDGEIYNTRIKLVHERQANSFAATFLIPETPLDEYMDDPMCIKSVRKMAEYFEVSLSTMYWRLKNLNMLSDVTVDYEPS